MTDEDEDEIDNVKDEDDTNDLNIIMDDDDVMMFGTIKQYGNHRAHITQQLATAIATAN